MLLNIYNIDHFKIKRITSIVSFIVIVICIKLMVPGPVGNHTSLYQDYNAPVWLYFLTTFILLIFSIIAFQSLMGLISIGKLEIDDSEISISKNNEKIQLQLGDLVEIKLIPVYKYSRIESDKINRIITLITNNNTYKYLITISVFEEAELIKRLAVEIDYKT